MTRVILIAMTLTVWLAIGFIVAVFLVAPAFKSEPDDRPITIKTLVPIVPATSP